ncbi:threonine--tRNA ligase [Anaplasma platys]|uniref:Threonine--tRNA ligase n=1 Tax=Anaplasma platys TaxID=949 RepID=A0A858PX38_9RICK|nr:threonine--tRNA ligase [Anaplasma platys]QJC27138.1 threonine--tRNA ligase [Anaplasma platys]
MITISTAPGISSSRTFSHPISGREVVDSMLKERRDEIVGLIINNTVHCLDVVIDKDTQIEPILLTSKEAHTILQNTAAVVLALSLLELFPEVFLALGGAKDDGFHYDFDLKSSLSEKDLTTIEKHIKKIAGENLPLISQFLDKTSAQMHFTSAKNIFKQDFLASGGETVPVCKIGKDLLLPVNGVVAPATGFLKAYKLTKLSGVYWQGESSNKMIHRIDGMAFFSASALEERLRLIKEAELRDHRRIAKELEICHIQNEALGQVFWHDKGLTLFRTVEQYIRGKLRNHGYSEIKTPIMVDRSLWERSGHWDKFKDNMFVVSDESKELAIKPMNCPCHVQIYKFKTRSYKDLPLRIAEFGTCHRNEPSGSLYGLMRVRGFTQDDAHIFCTPEQIQGEVLQFYRLLVEVYADFGFHDITVKLSDRPQNRIGSDDLWTLAENSLVNAMETAGVAYELNKGDGAFYGPKLEFILKDALGRSWQCGTVQLDFVLPTRLEAYYVGADGEKHHPVMIHRAILGTLERFLGILIEHYAGKLPAWLSPVQLAVITVNEDALEYARSLKKMAEEHDVRVELMASAESIGNKIRKSIFNKVPVSWVVGAAEVEQGLVSVRNLGSAAACCMGADKALKSLLTCVSIR